MKDADDKKYKRLAQQSVFLAPMRKTMLSRVAPYALSKEEEEPYSIKASVDDLSETRVLADQAWVPVKVGQFKWLKISTAPTTELLNEETTSSLV